MVCRLCLKAVPSESVIKLYNNLSTTTIETLEMVNLIEKYLHIEVRQDDIVSTMICQDCHDHLEEWNRFRENVEEKQLTLRNEFLEVQLKEECHFDDSSHDYTKDVASDTINADSKEMEQAIFECPIDILKSEMGDEKEEQEVVVPDILASELNKEDVFARSDAEFYPENDILTSEDDVPLIKLKSKKKITPKRKRTAKSTTPKKPKEPRKKGERKKHISAQELIATSIELKCDICQVQVNTWKELRQHFLLAHTRTPYIKCCDTVYEKQRTLVEHLQWHKNPDAFKCKMCNEVLCNSRDLTSHISSQHPDNVDLLENYECEHCFKQFRNFTIYKNHLRSHSKDRDVECQICNKRCATIYRLRSHIESVHNNVYHHICDICGKKFKSKTAFQKHYDEHQGIVEPAAQCSVCGAWLKNQYSLKVHLTIHETAQFPCDKCEKMFNTKKNLSRHKGYWHRMERNLKCSYCEKIFREKRNLDEHMATHTETQLYACPHCGKESRSKSNMYVHVKRQHPDEWWKSKQERYNVKPKTENKEQTATVGEEQLTNAVANDVYATEHQLRRHIASLHKDAPNHVCDICGRNFKSKDSFKKHCQMHQGITDPAVQCSICKRWLKNENSLRMHRFQHEERPSPCNICGEVFKTRRSLRKHIKYWHELEKNLHCNFCDKVFREKRNLDEHMATHTGAQLYTCPHCSKESRSKSNMYVHVKRQHPDEWWKSKVERLKLDPNTENPEMSQPPPQLYSPQQQQISFES